MNRSQYERERRTLQIMIALIVPFPLVLGGAVALTGVVDADGRTRHLEDSGSAEIPVG